MVIMGIDPSLASSGWAFIDKTGQKFKYLSSGVIKTNPKDSIYNRLAIIKASFDKVISQYKPNHFIIEKGFVMANADSSLKLAVARGVIVASIIDYLKNNESNKSQLTDEFITEVSPTFVKKAVTGSGSADKIQVDKMVKMILTLQEIKFTSNDETDAIAIALSIA